MLDVRFSSALTTLVFLGVAAEEGIAVVSSSQLAEHLNTNPSLVRKLLAPLVRDGLVDSVKGRTGGARLARSPQDIPLAEVYVSVIGDKPLWTCRPEGQHTCQVSAHTAGYFAQLTERAEQAVLTTLGDQTLANAMHELRCTDHHHTRPAGPATGLTHTGGTRTQA
ncbi:RrF2 family transcriptional regulator [Streptomyces sp. NPDC056987]|uniref:RrF2 family transcriptional regulator n=1 Tax=Streptomyces sp. NPDC056987 TaxID=3345988 RepID=UPI003643343E